MTTNSLDQQFRGQGIDEYLKNAKAISELVEDPLWAKDIDCVVSGVRDRVKNLFTVESLSDATSDDSTKESDEASSTKEVVFDPEIAEKFTTQDRLKLSNFFAQQEQALIKMDEQIKEAISLYNYWVRVFDPRHFNRIYDFEKKTSLIALFEKIRPKLESIHKRQEIMLKQGAIWREQFDAYQIFLNPIHSPDIEPPVLAPLDSDYHVKMASILDLPDSDEDEELPLPALDSKVRVPLMTWEQRKEKRDAEGGAIAKKPIKKEEVPAEPIEKKITPKAEKGKEVDKSKIAPSSTPQENSAQVENIKITPKHIEFAKDEILKIILSCEEVRKAGISQTPGKDVIDMGEIFMTQYPATSLSELKGNSKYIIYLTLGYKIRYGHYQEAFDQLEQMQLDPNIKDEKTFLDILSACKNVESHVKIFTGQKERKNPFSRTPFDTPSEAPSKKSPLPSPPVDLKFAKKEKHGIGNNWYEDTDGTQWLIKEGRKEQEGSLIPFQQKAEVIGNLLYRAAGIETPDIFLDEDFMTQSGKQKSVLKVKNIPEATSISTQRNQRDELKNHPDMAQLVLLDLLIGNRDGFKNLMASPFASGAGSEKDRRIFSFDQAGGFCFKALGGLKVHEQDYKTINDTTFAEYTGATRFTQKKNVYGNVLKQNLQKNISLLDTIERSIDQILDEAVARGVQFLEVDNISDDSDLTKQYKKHLQDLRCKNEREYYKKNIFRRIKMMRDWLNTEIKIDTTLEQITKLEKLDYETISRETITRSLAEANTIYANLVVADTLNQDPDLYHRAKRLKDDFIALDRIDKYQYESLMEKGESLLPQMQWSHRTSPDSLMKILEAGQLTSDQPRGVNFWLGCGSAYGEIQIHMKNSVSKLQPASSLEGVRVSKNPQNMAYFWLNHKEPRYAHFKTMKESQYCKQYGDFRKWRVEKNKGNNDKNLRNPFLHTPYLFIGEAVSLEHIDTVHIPRYVIDDFPNIISQLEDNNISYKIIQPLNDILAYHGGSIVYWEKFTSKDRLTKALLSKYKDKLKFSYTNDIVRIKHSILFYLFERYPRAISHILRGDIAQYSEQEIHTKFNQCKQDYDKEQDENGVARGDTNQTGHYYNCVGRASHAIEEKYYYRHQLQRAKEERRQSLLGKGEKEVGADQNRFPRVEPPPVSRVHFL